MEKSTNLVTEYITYLRGKAAICYHGDTYYLENNTCKEYLDENYGENI